MTMTNTLIDFEVGIEIVVQNTKGRDIAYLGSNALSDKTMQMIMEDVADYLREARDE